MSAGWQTVRRLREFLSVYCNMSAHGAALKVLSNTEKILRLILTPTEEQTEEHIIF
jgi:hypothetical protein